MHESAPIIELDDDPTPKAIQVFWFHAKDGTRLRAALCPADPNVPPKGSILFVPGRTEYIEKYFEFIREMTVRGICVATLDLRGQGLSDRPLDNPLLGHVRSFDEYAQDIETLWPLIKDQMPGPHVLMAHSMGGAIACDLLRRGNVPMTQFAASSPLLGFANAGGFLRGLIKFLYWLGCKGFSPPGLSGGGALDPAAAKVLTSDPVRFDRDIRRNTVEPKLQLAGPTVGWLCAALRVFEELDTAEGFGKITIPVHFTYAGREALVSNDAIIKACRKMPNATCVQSPDALHELFQERDALRKPFIQNLFALLGVQDR